MEHPTNDDDPFSGSVAANGHKRSRVGPGDAASKESAVTALLRNRALSNTFGSEGQYRVETTIAINRRAWRYNCRVLHNGQEIDERFSTVAVDRSRQMGQEPEITDDMRIAFATEAAEKHLIKCQEVVSFLASQPAPRRHWPIVVSVAVGLSFIVGASLLWLSGVSPGSLFLGILDDRAPDVRPVDPPSRGWKQNAFSLETRANELWSIELRQFEEPSARGPIEETPESQKNRPTWLKFDSGQSLLTGTAPSSPVDQRYHLRFRKVTNGGQEQLFLVEITILSEESIKKKAQALRDLLR
jgi:hypothetical protein